jgi:hypothetical protein
VLRKALRAAARVILIDEKPELAKRLHAQLETWRQAIGARKMRPNFDYVPQGK